MPALLALLALLAAFAWLIGAGQDQSRLVLPRAQAAPWSNPAAPAKLASTLAAAPSAATLRANLRLAEHTYCSYRDSSRYPPGSRPVAEQPDQVYPNAPVTEMNPMRKDGGGSDPQVQLQTAQTRVYLAAGEAVSFSLRAVDADGAVLPLVVTGATAEALTVGAQRAMAVVSLPFSDDGSGADPVAGDFAFAATLAPAQTAFAGFNGTIRTRVRYSVAGQAGSVAFDVIHSAELPALWRGPPREVVEEGALRFYLPAQMRQAGRYIVSGRVDDAHGKPFALLTFNEQLPAGPNEIVLTVAGKLLRDQQAALPLTLRDVDGYLLKENTDPDRALMARLPGPQLTTAAHPLRRFDDAEWHSEQRERYLAEFERDARAARAALARVDGADLPAPACPMGN